MQLRMMLNFQSLCFHHLIAEIIGLHHNVIYILCLGSSQARTLYQLS